MTQHDPAVSMRQMLKTAQEAVAMVQGAIARNLDANRMLELALIRLTEVLGEAANRIPREVQAGYPQIPWSLVISMRHRLIHGYDAVDLDALWDTVTDDLPPLIVELEAALSK